jgi:nitrogen fixation NifU-like protein
MNNRKLDVFLDTLQEDILQDAYRVYGPKGYDRWMNPRHHHILENPDCRAALTGECGDTIEIYLKMDKKKNKVSEASYRTSGCASSSICGSFAAEIAIGKGPEEILDMTAATILNELGRFPKNEEHCAHLAVTTLKEAINTYMQQETLQRKTK